MFTRLHKLLLYSITHFTYPKPQNQSASSRIFRRTSPLRSSSVWWQCSFFVVGFIVSRLARLQPSPSQLALSRCRGGFICTGQIWILVGFQHYKINRRSQFHYYQPNDNVGKPTTPIEGRSSWCSNMNNEEDF